MDSSPSSTSNVCAADRQIPEEESGDICDSSECLVQDRVWATYKWSWMGLNNMLFSKKTPGGTKWCKKMGFIEKLQRTDLKASR